jgi:hypothetical protein
LPVLDSICEVTVRWLVPDLATTAAIVSVLYLFFLLGGATSLFRDSDAGWHIVNGQRMLSTGTLPATDPFSFSKPDQPWIAWEWGADVLTGLAYRIAGLGGVAVFYGFAIGASVWMWFKLNWAAGGNFVFACLFAAPMLSTVNLHWLARPHILSWLFLLGTVWLCERMPQQLNWVRFAGIALASAAWANIHGSFFFGPTIFLIYLAGNWLRSVIWSAPPTGHAASAAFSQAAIAAALGSFINPHGWQLHRHVLAYLTDSELLDRIGEFQSFNFHADGATQIILALALGLAGGLAAISTCRPERFLLAVVLTAGAIRSARVLPIAALLLLPLANGSLTSVLVLAQGLNRSLRQKLDDLLTYGDRLRVLDRRFNGFVLLPLVVLLIHPRAAFPADQFPVAAAASIPANARVFAPDKFGGYLIYRFDGARKVFFDGRSDFYGADFLKAYSRLVQVRPGWTEEFARWNFTHALLPPDYSLVPALEARGWTELYRDKTAVLLAPGAEHGVDQ